MAMRKSGKSYTDIESRMNIPRSTLSEWFKHEEWSKEIRKNLTAIAQEKSRVRIIRLDRARGERLTLLYEQAQKEAREEFELFKYHPLFLAGLMVYWGEGDRVTKGLIRIANIDPDMLRLFVGFLERVCGIERKDIRAAILYYPDLNIEECLKYWSREIGLETGNFIKSTLIQGRHKTKRVRYGVGSIYVSSSYLKVKILEWIRLAPKELMSAEYYANIGNTAGMV